MCLPSTLRRTVVIPMTSQFGCLELLITRTFLSGPVKFEITRVDCILRNNFQGSWGYSKCPKILYSKVSDKMAHVNSADPDQTAPEGAV